MHRPPTTLVLMHCLFADYGLCGHKTYKADLPSYLALPHLYAVCAIDETSRPERMVCGLLIKTNVAYEDPGFLNALEGALAAVPALASHLHEHVSLQPAPVDGESAMPLTEDQGLQVFKQLWSEHMAQQVTSRFR
jgi:hypothetical protein